MVATPTEKKELERVTAKKTGAEGKTSQKTQIKVTGPYMEILIGGPYTKSSGEEMNYGHAALRVVVNGKDRTYDFGRYGLTWGAFDSEGEGILRVWSVFDNYIKGENSYGRSTTGYVYILDKSSANNIINYFKKITDASKKISIKIIGQSVYRLNNNYHATYFNCTTVTIDGALQSGKPVVKNPSYYDKMQGLDTLGKIGAVFSQKPDNYIFMPFDLQNMIEHNTECKYAKKNLYGNK